MDYLTQQLLKELEYAHERLNMANESHFDPCGVDRRRVLIAKAKGPLGIVGGSIARESAVEELAAAVREQTP